MAVDDIEARRAARRANTDTAKAAQVLKDVEAIDALEEAAGESYHTMTANGFKPGAPVKAAFRAPTSAEYKRYADMVGKATQKGDAGDRRKASEMLGASCLIYPPEGDDRKSMLDAHPGVLLSVSIEAVKLAELRTEDEGKG